MGADWYVIRTLYGCPFDISSYPSYRSIVQTLYQLQPFVAPPFQIMGILSEFHSRMEFDEADNLYLDRFASIVIGFVPDADLERTVRLAKELSEYVIDNPVFEGFDIATVPRFVSGIEWYPEDIDSSDASDASDSSGSSVSSGSWTSEESTLSDSDDITNYMEEAEAGEAGEAGTRPSTPSDSMMHSFVGLKL